MKGIRQRWLFVPTVAAAVALAAPSLAQTTASTERPAKSKPSSQRTAPQSNGHVYLLRGLLNIFSLGMDDLASKIKARGISASVHNHSEWQTLADTIAVQYKARQHGTVVLVGHSLGADAVMFMAEYLGKKGVPVALVVPFDGTGSFAASANVGQVYNLTQRDYAHMRRGAGFRGQLHNVDVSGQGYGHIDIDKSARLHALVLARIQSVIRTRGGPRTIEEAAPARRPAAEPSAPAGPASSATSAPGTGSATSAQPAAAPAASAAAAVSPSPAAPATTASASGGATVASDRPASTPPVVSRPATTESKAEPGAKPALRF